MSFCHHTHCCIGARHATHCATGDDIKTKQDFWDLISASPVIWRSANSSRHVAWHQSTFTLMGTSRNSLSGANLPYLLIDLESHKLQGAQLRNLCIHFSGLNRSVQNCFLWLAPLSSTCFCLWYVSIFIPVHHCGQGFMWRSYSHSH